MWTLLTWLVNCGIFYFAMKKDGAPDWALDLGMLIAVGISLILMNQDNFFGKKE